MNKYFEPQENELTTEEIIALYNYLNPSDFYISNFRWERKLKFYQRIGLEKLFFRVGQHRMDILPEIPLNPN